jgi:hypothetical protein
VKRPISLYWNIYLPVDWSGKGNETDPGWDLALLTSCDHLIITYGSYGTMAAYFIAGTTLKFI